MICLIVIILVVFFYLIDKESYAKLNGGAKRAYRSETIKLIGPLSCIYYKNFAGKELFLFGEVHLPTIPDSCRAVSPSVSTYNLSDLLNNKIRKNKVIVEAVQIIDNFKATKPYKEENYKAYQGTRYLIKSFEEKSKENSNIEIYDPRLNSLAMSLKLGIFYSRAYINPNPKLNGTIRNNYEMHKWVMDFLSEVNSMSELYDELENGLFNKNYYNLLSNKNKQTIDKIRADNKKYIAPFKDTLDVYIKEYKTKTADIQIVYKIHELLTSIIAFISDVTLFMKVLNSPSNIPLFLYNGASHSRNLMEIIEKYYKIKPSNIWFINDERDKKCLVMDNIPKTLSLFIKDFESKNN